MENYICINGKKAELTEEQIKALGIELPKKSPFKRVNKRTPFYFITNKGYVEYGVEVADFHCNGLHNVANYCTDKALMEQRALHETLNRLLWRYSMEHDGDKIDWSTTVTQRKYNILYNDADKQLVATWIYNTRNIGAVYFISQSVAEAAIKEIIEPFMKAHPEFKW